MLSLEYHVAQITNSAVHAKWAVVFAQLHIGGRNEGIHGFLVRIRNEVRSCPCKLAVHGHPPPAQIVAPAKGQIPQDLVWNMWRGVLCTL